jgi:hypothetical protein
VTEIARATQRACGSAAFSVTPTPGGRPTVSARKRVGVFFGRRRPQPHPAPPPPASIAEASASPTLHAVMRVHIDMRADRRSLHGT